MKQGDPLDPKALISEAYKISGIVEPECRSIFLDWALSYQGEPRAGVEALLERYSGQPKDHPMSRVLREGLGQVEAPRRRGGRRARVPD